MKFEKWTDNISDPFESTDFQEISPIPCCLTDLIFTVGDLHGQTAHQATDNILTKTHLNSLHIFFVLKIKKIQMTYNPNYNFVK